MKSTLARRADGMDWAWLVILAVAGLAVGWQGWRGTILTPDYLPYVDGAEQLLAHGRFPSAGHLSSLASYFPPGGAYWFIPGIVLFEDARLFETPMMAACYVGSLVLLFVIARAAFGLTAARISIGLFALSQLAVGYWDGFAIGHFYNPFLYLCGVWCTMRWVADRRAVYVAIALAIVSAAVYFQHPLFGLMLLPLPILWAMYRPPIALQSVALVAITSVVLWMPFLRFESSRHFVDVRSQLLGVSLLPADYASSWCNPGLRTIGTHSELVQPPRSKVPARLARIKDSGAFTALTANTDQASVIPGVSIFLLVAILASLCRSELRARTDRLQSADARVLAVVLVVPWAALLLLTEPGRGDRTIWLWPMQLAFAAALIADGLAFLRRRIVRTAVAAVAVAIVAANPFVVGQLQGWKQNGWTGIAPEQLQAVSYVAERVKAHGLTHASIGYRMWSMGFIARYNILDKRYKWGSEYDAWLRYAHRLTNDNHCAEGVSGNDEWRIIQVVEPDSGVYEIVEGDMTQGFEPEARFGSLVVLRRAGK